VLEAHIISHFLLHPLTYDILIKQNKTIVATFGQLFTSGAQVNPVYPVYLPVRSNTTATVLVSQLGSNTSQIAFTIKAPNGTTIYQRSTGTNFTSDTTFATFCLIGGCPSSTSLKLTITMTDSHGDGRSGNVLAIRQNNTVVGTFGSAFIDGDSTPPVNMIVQGNLRAQIIVSTLGSWTDKIGFVAKAPNCHHLLTHGRNILCHDYFQNILSTGRMYNSTQHHLLPD
jgi:hypothetical protein